MFKVNNKDIRSTPMAPFLPSINLKNDYSAELVLFSQRHPTSKIERFVKIVN